MKNCERCGKKTILYYVGNKPNGSPIYVCNKCMTVTEHIKESREERADYLIKIMEGK